VYLILELCSGQNLEAYREAHTTSEAEVVSILYQIARGLELIAACKVVHRDIKPENLLVDSKGTLKNCDMGFAKGLHDGPLTDYVATRWYRPP
jgi:serine/threonine protein kinase